MALRGAAIKLGVVAAAVSFAAPALATTYDEIQVTTGTNGSINPVVSNGRIAYTQRVNGVSQIFLYDVATGTTRQVTTDATADTLEDMDGNYLVYAHTSATTGKDIYGYDLSVSKEFVVSSAPNNQDAPAISGSTVVWQDARTDAGDIYTANLSTVGGTPSASGETGQVVGATTDKAPRISGSWIVWVRFDPITTLGSVFAKNLTTGTVVTVADAAGVDNVDADIDGTTVVYASAAVTSGSVGPHDIYAFDLNSRITTQVSTSAADESRPRISGTDVVWQDDRNAAKSTCGPQNNQNCGTDLYGADLSNLAAGDQPLETSAGNQYLQDIQGDDIAFTDLRSGINEIYDLHRASVSTTGTGDPCDPASGAPVLYSATYTRGHGQPQTVSGSFASGFSSGTVCLTLTHVSSAEIDLNGTQVFGPDAFNPNLTAAEANVSLGLNNTLDVTLRGKPCDGGCGDGHGDDGHDAHAAHFDGHHHHHGDGDDTDDDDGGNGSNGSTCSTIGLRVVGPIPAAPTTPPGTVGTYTCEVHGATGFDLRALLPLLLAAGLIVARRRRA